MSRWGKLNFQKGGEKESWTPLTKGRTLFVPFTAKPLKLKTLRCKESAALFRMALWAAIFCWVWPPWRILAFNIPFWFKKPCCIFLTSGAVQEWALGLTNLPSVEFCKQRLHHHLPGVTGTFCSAAGWTGSFWFWDCVILWSDECILKGVTILVDSGSYNYKIFSVAQIYFNLESTAYVISKPFEKRIWASELIVLLLWEVWLALPSLPLPFLFLSGLCQGSHWLYLHCLTYDFSFVEGPASAFLGDGFIWMSPTPKRFKYFPFSTGAKQRIDQPYPPSWPALWYTHIPGANSKCQWTSELCPSCVRTSWSR